MGPGEVGHGYLTAIGEAETYLLELGELGQFGEFLIQAEFVQQLYRAGMHGVAAEITEEISVLLQHAHLHTPAGQQ